ncbi:MAG: hypothetical protein IIZ87_04760 [Selenomonas sp.]|nr:hypothetical protein [Selenomonas sp.]
MTTEMMDKLIWHIELYARHYVNAKTEHVMELNNNTAMGYIDAVEDIYGKDIAKALENRFWKIALG